METKSSMMEEIKDPVAKAKLAGIQESVTGIDGMILQLKRTMDEKHGVIAAADAIAKRLFDECLPIQKAVDEEKMGTEEAKIRISTIQKLTDIVRNVGVENRRELTHYQGQIVGLEKAAKAAEEKFKGEALKYERWERMQNESDDLGRGAPEATQDAAEAPKPKAKPGPKPKGTKKGKGSNA